MGSVSPASTTPLQFRSSWSSRRPSKSVSCDLGSLGCAGTPYAPLTSTKSEQLSESVSTSVGSVLMVLSSPSNKPSLSESASVAFVSVSPSTSATRFKQPLRGSHGKVCVTSGAKQLLFPPSQLVSHEGLMYSAIFSKPSPSLSPNAPSEPFLSVGSRPTLYSYPSGIPSPSESWPSGSSSATPSPSSSSDAQSASPSLSGSEPSTKPSLSLSKPSVQMFPGGSSSHSNEPGLGQS